MSLHPKVRWAALASTLVAAITATVAALGPNGPAWVGAVAAGLAALVAGFAAPAVAGQDDLGPES